MSGHFPSFLQCVYSAFVGLAGQRGNLHAFLLSLLTGERGMGCELPGLTTEKAPAAGQGDMRGS